MQYVGLTWSTSVEFDASWDRGEPYTFKLGAGKVIPGWDQGIPGMRKGRRRELTIPAELAYGAQGSPPKIGPNSAPAPHRRPGQAPRLERLAEGALERPEQQRRAAPRASRSRCSSQSRIAPSMNHSHARTAVRRAGRARAGPARRGSARRSPRARLPSPRAPPAPRPRRGRAWRTRRRSPPPRGGRRRGCRPAAPPATVTGPAANAARQLDRLLLERRREVGLLAREVVVEERLGDPRLAGDRRHRQRVVVVPREQRGAELEQPAAALLDVEAGVRGWLTPRGSSRPSLPC